MGIRINKFIAQATGISRRSADGLIANGEVTINGKPAAMGSSVGQSDIVSLRGKILNHERSELNTVLLNKPIGYVCSRKGQGSPTIYDLLPQAYHSLKPAGRLDKDSSGLVILTSDGAMANRLTHPKFQKNKIYQIELNVNLKDDDKDKITNQGVVLEDGISKFQLNALNDTRQWQVTMSEGRNRQIRRTFYCLGYTVTKLHRVRVGQFNINNLSPGHFEKLSN
jgi:23S rRNA pseudouridine2605 synthase